MRNVRDKAIVTATSFTDFEVNKEAERGRFGRESPSEYHPRGPAVPSDGRGEDVQGNKTIEGEWKDGNAGDSLNHGSVHQWSSRSMG
ncbi:uncharacterized protein AtWU_02803 [Aspergillus tubingensis]|uniref:uncharacterized protein n=1 Tax=Aspergillus tubingensis TaxID=5068 RepID=UPI001577E85C|nr:uncharacterized protein AtWU_02803 [Aspergillus tubingensis]GFN13005.1 hypothetical protein AtWU_02803 [Aspergillus tubingensis]